jgi:hypothetical protein
LQIARRSGQHHSVFRKFLHPPTVCPIRLRLVKFPLSLGGIPKSLAVFARPVLFKYHNCLFFFSLPFCFFLAFKLLHKWDMVRSSANACLAECHLQRAVFDRQFLPLLYQAGKIRMDFQNGIERPVIR